jgi:hypothetical protein
MGPSEIGHAAAYEAYRTCRTMYEMLGPDIERQRERLIGLAVAEGEDALLRHKMKRHSPPIQLRAY